MKVRLIEEKRETGRARERKRDVEERKRWDWRVGRARKDGIENIFTGKHFKFLSENTVDGKGRNLYSGAKRKRKGKELNRMYGKESTLITRQWEKGKADGELDTSRKQKRRKEKKRESIGDLEAAWTAW